MMDSENKPTAPISPRSNEVKEGDIDVSGSNLLDVLQKDDDRESLYWGDQSEEDPPPTKTMTNNSGDYDDGDNNNDGCILATMDTSAITTTDPGQRRICKYYNTTRGCKLQDNCEFIHDRKVCAFYNTPNGCYKGDECTFEHTITTMITPRLHNCPNDGCGNYCLGRQCAACHEKNLRRRPRPPSPPPHQCPECQYNTCRGRRCRNCHLEARRRSSYESDRDNDFGSKMAYSPNRRDRPRYSRGNYRDTYYRRSNNYYRDNYRGRDTRDNYRRSDTRDNYRGRDTRYNYRGSDTRDNNPRDDELSANTRNFRRRSNSRSRSQSRPKSDQRGYQSY